MLLNLKIARLEEILKEQSSEPGTKLVLNKCWPSLLP